MTVFTIYQTTINRKNFFKTFHVHEMGKKVASSLRYKPFSAYMQNMMFMRPLKVTASADSAIWISLFSTDFEQYKIIGAVTIIIDTPTTRAFHQNFLFNLTKFQLQ